MVGFFIKKAFFDGWDNLITLALLNIGFILLLLGFLTIPMFFAKTPAVLLVILVMLIYLLHFYAGGVSLYTAELMKGRNPGFREIIPGVLSVWRLSAVFGTISSFQSIVLVVGFPFYLSIGGVIGLTAVSILFWFSVFWWLMSIWLFPSRTQLDKTVRGTFRKSLFFCLDNPGFTLFLGVYTVFNLLLSLVTAFLIPGVSSVLYSHQIAMKLRLYKYDYLEEHPDAERRKIPWDVLLLDEKEKLGQRTLKGMIFPWKE